MILIKSARELDKMRESARITQCVLNEVINHIRVGSTTYELDRIAEQALAQYDALPAFKGYRGYPASVCVSVNEEVVHGIPGKRKLREGDIVSLDFGVLKDGYYGDMAVTVGVGKISPEREKLLRVTKESLLRGIEQAQPGKRLGDISHAIESYVVNNGFSIVRDYVGHGIGREMHEEPQIPNFGEPNTGPVLKEGMVFAIEPMVNVGTYKVKTLADGWTVVTRDKKASAHFEHTVAITENGPEVLTWQKTT
ncbi:MAG: type I methionyl aminopeptidase [Candidatus Auribacter fodinae]|jgi:methionyl aminopeptidase|uniref:Methionine aminopeptidase n=1 Tax=Candidatus Auribacter fodinae TaxID=2093366 RepID=A0A3A4R7Y7_9BACT|nr:MAG: type I methionyl aminopeptidase [Candidatus Auribacter fodinae]